MPEEKLKLETRFSSARGLFPYIAGALGLVVIVVIVMIVTGVGVQYLPGGDEYFSVLIPKAPDGSEPLALMTLHQTSDEKTLTVDGSVKNRTESTISGLVAVIDVKDRYTLPVETVSVPVEPADLDPGAVGTFRTTVNLGENGLGGYGVKFQLQAKGLFLPHKDERAPDTSIDAGPAQ